MGVDVAQDQVDVCLVSQHDIVEQLQAELGKVDRPLAQFEDFISLFRSDTLRQAAGDGCAGVYLAAADHLDDGVSGLAGVDDLSADLQPNLVDHAQDVAFRHGRIRPHHKIRAGQGIKVGGVVGDEKGGI